MKQPRLSLIIPAYNEEKVISGTLNCLLLQDYPDYEIIVVDNGSTDRTSYIAKQFVNIKVVKENRRGILWARERGRKEATGQIIVNIDADCLPEKDWLQRGVLHFFQNDVVAVTGPYDYYDGSFLFRNTSLFLQMNVYFLMNKIIQLPFIKKGAVLIGGNNFIRSDILHKTNGYDTSITFYGEDTDTAKRISKHGKVVFDRNLHMKTSSRRFKEEGTMSITIKYFFHFFKTIFKAS